VATYKYSGELTSHINFLNYVQNLNNGIALWSNSIVFTYSSNSLNEITVIALPNIEYDGFVSATPNSSTGHIAEWTIFINALHYDNPNVKPMNDHEKTLLFAHEIGHTYGLGHFGGYIENGQYIYPIMFPSIHSSQIITSNDKAGMSVVTHQHKHDGPLVDP